MSVNPEDLFTEVENDWLRNRDQAWADWQQEIAAGRTDPCTRAEFDADYDPPRPDWVQFQADLDDDAREERADQLREERRLHA